MYDMIYTGAATAAGLLLLAVTVRTWLVFTQRSDQFSGLITKTERLIEQHRARLEQVRTRMKQAERMIEAALEECDELERDTQAKSDELEQATERLERVRPSHRRVDTEERGDDPWLGP